LSFFVRTSSLGSGPDHTIDDLGITIFSGSNWTNLLLYDSNNFVGGEFTPESLSSSEDLYNAIKNGNLEASSDGYTNNVISSTYGPSFISANEFSNAIVGLNTSSSSFVFPNYPNSLSDSRTGEALFYQATNEDGYLSIYDGTNWISLKNVFNIENQGTPLSSNKFNAIDFIGSGVTSSYSAGKVLVNIPGISGGGNGIESGILNIVVQQGEDEVFGTVSGLSSTPVKVIPSKGVEVGSTVWSGVSWNISILSLNSDGFDWVLKIIDEDSWHGPGSVTIRVDYIWSSL